MVIATPFPALPSSLPHPLSISESDLPSLSTPSSFSPHHVASAQPISRWAGLFKSSSSSVSTALSSFTPAFLNGAAVAPKEVVAEGISKWKEHLVGSFLGKKVPYFMVLKELEKVLQCKGAVELSSDGDVFYINCKNPGHRKILIEGEPVFVAGRILVIREWSSELEGKINPFSTIPLWINLEIPRELWMKVGISFAASLFGTPLRMDEHTARMNRTKFARVCVEVASDFKYPSTVPVDLGTRLGGVKATYSGNLSSVLNVTALGTKQINALQRRSGWRRGLQK